MAEKFDPMISSVSNRPVTNLTTAPWEQHPAVPSDVGVVTSSQSQLKDLIGLFCMVTLNLIALLANIGVMVAISRAPHLKRFAFVCHLCAVDLPCTLRVATTRFSVTTGPGSTFFQASASNVVPTVCNGREVVDSTTSSL